VVPESVLARMTPWGLCSGYLFIYVGDGERKIGKEVKNSLRELPLPSAHTANNSSVVNTSLLSFDLK
jgi:hypothetical protein